MRQLTSTEEQRIKCLTQHSVSLTLIEPTLTGLKKGILDATIPVKRYLQECDLHDYDSQGQGAKEHGVYIEAELFTTSLIIPSKASLYRPTTKKGDPRIWFKGLPDYVDPNDILALISFDGKICAINLTQIDIEAVLSSEIISPLKELIQHIDMTESTIAQELLAKISAIAKNGPLKASVCGDTAIGHSLETALGIKINSSKKPDYKGIELKSFRSKKSGATRKTLFAQVANWELSKFKSSREILDNFGYNSGEDFKLYCTLSTQNTNSQGLTFNTDQVNDWLVENSNKSEVGDFAIWEMAKLRERLLEKHNETFWVSADSVKSGGDEYFQFTKILHTRKPIVSQFDLLLERGNITMDHLIKRNSKGRVSEKGPLFKIAEPSIEMLFPPSKSYELI